MKKMKRILGVFLVSLMLFCTGITVFAAEKDDPESRYGITQEEILSAVQTYYENVAALSDSELEENLVSYADDEVVTSYFKSWMDVKENLGAFVKTIDDEMVVTMTDNGFETVLPIEFKNKTIELKMVFDEDEGVNSVVFEEEMTLGTIFKKAGLNTVLGMGIVFTVLILISFIIYLLGVFCGGVKKTENAPKASVADRSANVPAKEEEMVAAIAAAAAAQADDTELVAVISAAIAASTGMSTDDFVVRSIRKVRRSR